MRFHRLIPALAFCLMAAMAVAQDNGEDVEDEFDRRKKQPANKKESPFNNMQFGGQFWLSLGNPTYIELSPMAFVPLNKRMIAGLGFTYMYQSITQGATRFEFSVYGPRAMTQYYVLPSFFLHGEVESLNLPFYDPMQNREVREWVTSPLIGAGYSQRFGRGFGGLYFALLYNPVHNPDRSPYGSPIVVRMGMIF